MTTSIRQATVHDLDQAAELFDAYRQFYGQAADPVRARAFIAARFHHHESVILLALDAEDAVGFVQLYPVFSSMRAQRAYLLNDLYVAPPARRRGVARRLLEAAARFARANGAASMSLSTAADNHAAQRLYAALGWQRETQFVEYHLDLTRSADDAVA